MPYPYSSFNCIGNLGYIITIYKKSICNGFHYSGIMIAMNCNNGFQITGMLVSLPKQQLYQTGKVALKVRTGGSKKPRNTYNLMPCDYFECFLAELPAYQIKRTTIFAKSCFYGKVSLRIAETV